MIIDPTDPDGASLKIETLHIPVAKWVHSFKSWFGFFTFLTGFFGLVCFLIYIDGQKQAKYFYDLGMIFLATMFLIGMTPQFLWRRLYRGPVFGWYPKVLANPDLTPIKTYMARCANGEIKVKDDKNARVDRNFFENALSILLLSDAERNRVLVKSEYRLRSYRRQLRVESINGSAVRVDQFMAERTQKIVSTDDVTATDVPLVLEQITQIGEAEPKRTNFSDSHEWIAGGTLAQFEAGLAIFLKLVPSHSDAMFTLIMMTARQELRVRRKADSQEKIIERITEALMVNNLKQHGSSRTTIMNLLHGKYRKKDITGYFLNCRD
jgi:hypothetical protein